jgi:hypothetical protein
MAKTLPILGAVGAALSALFVTLVAGDAALLAFPLLAIVAAVFCFFRGLPGAVAGVALVAVAVLDTLSFGSISGRGGNVLFGGFHDSLGPAFQAGTGLAVAAAAVALHWTLYRKPWMPYAGVAIAAVAYVAMRFVDPLLFGSASSLSSTLPTALLCLLAAGGPLLALLPPAKKEAASSPAAPPAAPQAPPSRPPMPKRPA